MSGTCPITVTRTFTVTDACLNTGTLVQTITIDDSTDPVISGTIVDQTVEACDTAGIMNGNLVGLAYSETSVALTDEQFTAEGGIITEACDYTIAYIDTMSGTCPITVTRTFTVTDACLNTGTLVQTITVGDTTAPTFTAPDDIEISCEEDASDLTLTGNAADEADNCSLSSLASYSDEVTPVECVDKVKSIIKRTWTLVDDCGNPAEVKVQTITVVDKTSPIPVVTLPTQISVSCTSIPVAVSPGFTDNCSTNITISTSEESTYNQDTPQDYEIIRKWTATDECGNETTVQQTITVTADEFITTTSDSKCYDDGVIDLDDYISDKNDNASWTFISGVSTPSLDGSSFNPSNLADLLGDYTFSYTYTTDMGCLETTEVTITIDSSCIVLPCSAEDVIISKAVTPNGDQYNPSFDIYGIEACGFVANVKIFNRWGALIYESDNYTLGEGQGNWEGQAHKSSIGNSDTVPNGTYYYIVILENSGLEPFTGPVYLGTK